MLIREGIMSIQEDNQFVLLNCSYSKMSLMIFDYYKQRYNASTSSYNLIEVESITTAGETNIVESKHLIEDMWLVYIHVDRCSDIKKVLAKLTYSENAIYLFSTAKYAKFLQLEKELRDVLPKKSTCLKLSLNWVNKDSIKYLLQMFIKSIDPKAEYHVLNNLKYDTEIFYDFLFECRKYDHVEHSVVKKFRSINTNSWILFRSVIDGRTGTERKDKKFIRQYKFFIEQEGFNRAHTILKNMFKDLLFVKKLYQEGYICSVAPIDYDNLREQFPIELKYLSIHKISKYMRVLKGLSYIEIISFYVTLNNSKSETALLHSLYTMSRRGHS